MSFYSSVNYKMCASVTKYIAINTEDRDVFANNTALIKLTYLPTLCVNLEKIIICGKDTYIL